MRTITAISMPNFYLKLSLSEKGKFVLTNNNTSIIVRVGTVYEALKVFNEMYDKLIRNYN